MRIQHTILMSFLLGLILLVGGNYRECTGQSDNRAKLLALGIISGPAAGLSPAFAGEDNNRDRILDADSTPSGSRAFVWGACGHPSNPKELWKDPAAQISTLEQRGLRSYRFDVPLTSDNPQAAAFLRNMIELAKLHHITLHPILDVPFTWGNNATDGGRYPATEAGLERQGYDRVYPFVLQFAGQIRDWELENELSLRAGMKSGAGLSARDYSTPLAQQWAAVLRGMSKAIRDVRAKTGEPLRVVVDILYVDFGFVPFLEAHGVPIDKVAYHYYYEAGASPYKISYGGSGSRFPEPKGTVDLFHELRKIGKPVIINELNAAEITAPKHGKPYDDQKALVSLKRHIGYILAQKEAKIEGAEFYELYDEPWKDAAESNFGLMEDPKHAKTQMLLAAVYACGRLSAEEKATLVSRRLFTPDELADQLASCRPGKP